MKKTIIIISLAFAALTLISCGKKVIPMPGAEEGSDTTTGPNTPETSYTITNKLEYDPTFGTEENFNIVKIALDSSSIILDTDECVNVKESQFNKLKMNWVDSVIICDNSTEYKCPDPDHYTIQPNSLLIMKYQWNAPDLEKAELNTGSCKELK